MKRKIYTSTGDINLLYTREDDRRLIYDLGVEDREVTLSMFTDPKNFSWDKFKNEDPEYFNEKPSKNKYLLIEIEGEIVGVFCHVYHPAIIENMEFHIWLRSTKYTGRGIGSKVVNTMKEYIKNTYNIDTFIMRPWIKNIRAIKTYEKCGFTIVKDFNLNLFFTKEEIQKYGNGAYSIEETANMVSKLSLV